MQFGRRQGSHPVRTHAEEQCYIQWTIDMSKIGDGQKRQQFVNEKP